MGVALEFALSFSTQGRSEMQGSSGCVYHVIHVAVRLMALGSRKTVSVFAEGGSPEWSTASPVKYSCATPVRETKAARGLFQVPSAWGIQVWLADKSRRSSARG